MVGTFDEEDNKKIHAKSGLIVMIMARHLLKKITRKFMQNLLECYGYGRDI